MSKTSLVPVERMSLDDVSARIAVLLTPDAPAELVSDLWQSFTLAKRRLAEAEDVLHECVLDWLPENGGELVMGDTKLYAGKRTSEKCRDPHAALGAALRLSGGDVEIIEGILSANALKPGAFEQAFGAEARAEHFEKRTEDVVTVKTVNTRYLPKEHSK